MENHEIKNEIAQADKAINMRDFDGLMAFYTSDAALVVKPDRIVNGHKDIKEAHKRIAEYFNESLNVSQGEMVIIEAGDTALVLSKTFIESPGKSDSKYSSEREAIYVYKKDATDKWRCVIDNSYGFELLGKKA